MQKKKGFTLVEIIVVLIIIAILAAIAVPALMKYIKDAKDKQILAEMRSVYIAANAVYLQAVADDTAYIDNYVHDWSQLYKSPGGKAGAHLSGWSAMHKKILILADIIDSTCEDYELFQYIIVLTQDGGIQYVVRCTQYGESYAEPYYFYEGGSEFLVSSLIDNP